MAQTIEEIAEILNMMHDENQNNSEKLAKIVSNMNTKLELLAEDTEAYDLLKVYISELKNAVENKHAMSAEKLSALENSLDNLLAASEQTVKISQLKELFDSFTFSMGSLADKFSVQEESFDKISSKVDFVAAGALNKADIQEVKENSNSIYEAVKNDIEGVSQLVKDLHSENEQKLNSEMPKIIALQQDSMHETLQLRDEFRQAAASDIENSSRIVDGIYGLSDKISAVELGLSDIGRVEELKPVLEDLSDKLSQELFECKTALVANNCDAQIKEAVQTISENISNIESVILSSSDMIKAESGSARDDIQNLQEEILSFKDELNCVLKNSEEVSGNNFLKIDAELSDINANIQYLRDLNASKTSELLNSISAEINSINSELHKSINDDVRLNFTDIKNTLNGLVDNISELKENSVKYNDASVYSISSGFDTLKMSLENILAAFNSYTETANFDNKHNFEQVYSNIKEISLHIEELKSEIDVFTNGYTEKITSGMNDILLKFEGMNLDLSEQLEDRFNKLQVAIFEYLDKTNLNNNEYLQTLNEAKTAQSLQLQSISDDMCGLREHVDGIADSLKAYITQLKEAYFSVKSEDENKFSGKLVDFEALLHECSNEYEIKTELLQAKLAEFAQVIENKTSVTDEKFDLSLRELTALKADLSEVSDYLKTLKISEDEKFYDVISKLDSGIESVILSINNISEAVSSGMESSMKEYAVSIEEKFEKLISFVGDIKDGFESKDVFSELDEKLSAIKDEFAIVNTDMMNTVFNKSEDIISAISGIKNDINEFSKLDFNNVIQELKSQLEMSFMNFSVDINSEIADKSEAVIRLEQVYKEVYNRISGMEECLNEKIVESLEQLNSLLDVNSRSLQKIFIENIEDLKEDITSQIALLLNKNRTEEKIDALKEELIKNLESLKSDNKDVIDNAVKSLSEPIAKFSSDLKNDIRAGLQNKVEKSDLIDINLGVDDANQKLEDISSKIICNNQNLQQAISSLGKDVADVSGKNSNIESMLSLLNEKVDVLAIGDEDIDLGEELDDIKDLIFEQRKFIESSSDEKTAAIDKYLRDVLLKLDSVDLEKSTEDIKDTILNTLVSLVEDISFVEEAEEIKDFVEVKTDEINKNLVEMQNQLKQIAYSDDDFEYSYTLQDVESDIAKLRLAVSNISLSDFENLSLDIRRVVKAVDSLESSLTPDEIFSLKEDIEKLNEDILSISSRTNKLLLNSDESYKALSEGLNNFSNIICKLEDRINYLDNTEITDRIEKKLDNLHVLASESANADKVFHQVMMYLGEWIDTQTTNMSTILDNSSKIQEIKNSIDENNNLHNIISESKDEILEKLKDLIPDNTELVQNLENKFREQEERIDRLEMKLEKVFSAIEEKDDIMLNRKVDKIEKMISTLSANIEKLTSYVDEE